jgi:selenide, water dikinase
LAQVLRSLTPVSHPDLLVGTDTGDDAAVWRIDDERALVATADFITPIVDDARAWGRIAAANAVSDVYAMGGRPLFALNLVAWNSSELPTSELVEVLAGAAETAAQSGYVTIGGHTIDDEVPKFGLAVIGEVRPDRILTNSGLRPDEAVVLTKMLGTGVVATAIKSGVASDGVTAAAVESMCGTNARAAAAALRAGAAGCTDVTGFGLLGHLGQMALASGVDVVIDTARVPVLPGVRELVGRNAVAGGTRRNLEWMRPRVETNDVDDVTALILADAQTSGGLVFGAAPTPAAAAVAELTEVGVPATVIGETRPGTGRIILR